jgi:hypothetical protein
MGCSKNQDTEKHMLSQDVEDVSRVVAEVISIVYTKTINKILIPSVAPIEIM